MAEEENTPAPSPAGRMATRIGLIVAAAVLVAAALFAGRQFVGWFAKPDAQPVTVAIGGPFSLVDQDGRAVTEQTYRGKFMLIYFGFTYCPDVCPTSLTNLAQALDLLGKDGDKVVPVFMTVDPERDTPEYLKEYVVHFHPRMVGLTGTLDQVAKTAKAYRVYFAKTRAKDAAPDEYTMDHTSITYLMGPDGKFLTHFSHGTEPAVMTERIRKFL